MKTSQAGLNLIETSEGFRAQSYADVAGHMTVGFGHKILPGEDFSAGVTVAQAQVLLQADLGHVEAAMAQLLPADCTQGQWDACADAAYNLGINAFQTILGHGWSNIPAQLPRWVHAAGVVQLGLVARRQAEVELFTKG